MTVKVDTKLNEIHKFESKYSQSDGINDSKFIQHKEDGT